MNRSQLTITDPHDQIKNSNFMHSKRMRGINISHFCRDAVDDKIKQFNKEMSAKDLTKWTY